MNYITRRNPFRDLLDMQDTMDRLLERDFSEGSFFKSDWNLSLDVAEKADEFVVKASIPGIKPEDLEITYNNNVLTIKGTVQGENEEKDTKYHLQERWSGSFSRSISLPGGVKADEINASYEAGVLTLHLPKKEEVKPRRITIKTEEPKMIEGSFGNGKKNK
jgi:HSP20 family protein